jgi:hypothetical protein
MWTSWSDVHIYRGHRQVIHITRHLDAIKAWGKHRRVRLLQSEIQHTVLQTMFPK